MQLNFKKYGEGKPIIILHGIFGSSDNFSTVAKEFVKNNFSVYLLDARNHGQSPWTDSINYDLMAEDLYEFIEQNKLENAILLGHSMGGKTVMNYALKHDNFDKLIVVDIAPRAYNLHHEHIYEGLNKLEKLQINSRKEAEEIFKEYVSNLDEQQFILKNLYRQDANYLWRINIKSLSDNREEIVREINASKPCLKQTLFIKGGDSNYISELDLIDIKRLFPNYELVIIEGANHWVHAIKPKEFASAVLNFIS